MIDLSPIDHVVGRPARPAGPGRRRRDRSAQLDAATQEHGLAVPAGTVSHTGVGGLTLGGGMGLAHAGCTGSRSTTSSRREVVLADGRCVRASATEHPDLFWALRGGGGNFGVVTEFEFRLAPVGPIVQFGDAVRRAGPGGARAAGRARRRRLGSAATIEPGVACISGTTRAVRPREYHFAPVVSDDPRRVRRPGGARGRRGGGCARALQPAVRGVTPMPYVALQQMLDDGIRVGTALVHEGPLPRRAARRRDRRARRAPRRPARRRHSEC